MCQKTSCDSPEDKTSLLFWASPEKKELILKMKEEYKLVQLEMGDKTPNDIWPLKRTC